MPTHSSRLSFTDPIRPFIVSPIHGWCYNKQLGLQTSPPSIDNHFFRFIRFAERIADYPFSELPISYLDFLSNLTPLRCKRDFLTSVHSGQRKLRSGDFPCLNLVIIHRVTNGGSSNQSPRQSESSDSDRNKTFTNFITVYLKVHILSPFKSAWRIQQVTS